jgi:hypothetical protein
MPRQEAAEAHETAIKNSGSIFMPSNMVLTSAGKTQRCLWYMLVCMKRLRWFFLLAGLMAFFCRDGKAQCTLWNQAGCAAILPGGNPTLATFLSESQASFAAIRATDAALPQQKITLSGQNMPCAGAYLSTSPGTFGAQIINYAALMKSAAGVVVDDCNIWLSTLASSTTYTPSTITISSDCAGGATFAVNAGVPVGTGPNTRCAMLAKYDAYFVYAGAHGIKIRLGFVPAGGLATNATNAGGCALTPGSVTVAQYEACLGPLITAAMQRWGSAIDSVQVLEEPLGETATVQTFAVAQIASIINNFSAVVKAAVPGELVGASYTGYSFPVAGTPCGGGSHIDDCYWADAATGAASAGLDFLVLDVFTGNCDQSSNYYATELGLFVANYITQSGGKPVRVGQTQTPTWCTIGGPPNEPSAIQGCGWVIWQTSGLQTSWQTVFVGWASANGIQSVSVFFSLPWFNVTSSQTVNNCATGAYTGLAMSNLSPQDAAGTWRTLGLWPSLSLQGTVTLGGTVRVQ